MKKKVVPILSVLAVVVIGSIAFWMGRQTAPQTAEKNPVKSTALKMTSPADAEETPSPSGSVLTLKELLPYFEATYEYIWNDPNNYNAEYKDTEEEVDALKFFITNDGYAFLDNYTDSYLDWKHSNYLTNAYHLNFYERCINTVFAEKMYVYATPHTTLPPIGEFYRFDVIDNAWISDDEVWLKAEYQNTTIYYRYEDLAGGLSEAEIDALWEQHQAEQSFKEVNETVYATSTVNIREECSTSSTKLGQLKKGESITRIGIGQGEFSGWSKVKTSNGDTAYINSNYLSLTKLETNTSSGGSGSGSGSGSGGNNPPTTTETLPEWILNTPEYNAEAEKNGTNLENLGGYIDPDSFDTNITWTTP